MVALYNFCMPNKKKILIIGVGDDGAEGLTKQAADQIGAAEVLVGSATLLAKFPNFFGRKEVVGPDLDRLANMLDLTSSSTGWPVGVKHTFIFRHESSPLWK